MVTERVAEDMRRRNCTEVIGMLEIWGTHLKDALTSRKTYLFRPATERPASSFRRTIRSHMTTSFLTY